MNEPTCGDCIYFNGCYWCRKGRYTEGENDPITTCSDFERKIMPNIKITAEVDGKQVPLGTVSTETFEAIKALEKSKEIPVARVGHYHGHPDDRRLFLKITDSIRSRVANDDIEIIAVNLENGLVQNSWVKNDARCLSDLYVNIKPL